MAEKRHKSLMNNSLAHQPGKFGVAHYVRKALMDVALHNNIPISTPVQC